MKPISMISTYSECYFDEQICRTPVTAHPISKLFVANQLWNEIIQILSAGTAERVRFWNSHKPYLPEIKFNRMKKSRLKILHEKKGKFAGLYTARLSSRCRQMVPISCSLHPPTQRPKNYSSLLAQYLL